MTIRFRTIAPFLVLLLLVLACGRFTNSSGSAEDSAANDGLPPIPKEFVNMPSLIGKSENEMKALLEGGRVTNDFEDWFDYEFPWGKFNATFRDAKFESMAFTLPQVQGSDGPYWLGEKKERLGEMVGIDLNGKAPTIATDSFQLFEENVSGTETEITIVPTEPGKDLFYEIKVKLKD